MQRNVPKVYLFTSFSIVDELVMAGEAVLV